MLHLEQTRQNLLLAARENRSYAFLQPALRYLEQVPDDAQIRLLAVSQLSRLGLFGPAVELIDSAPDAVRQSPDLQAAVVRLRGQPSGQLDWQQMSEVFDANLQTLLARFEQPRPFEAKIREGVAGLDLYRCNDGNYQLSRRVGNGLRRWLPSFSESLRSIDNLDVCPAPGMLFCWPYLIEGVGFGRLIRRIHDGTRQMFLTFSPRIHILEPNCAQLAVWLHLDDHRYLLSDERVHLWIGPTAAEAFATFHRTGKHHPLPQAVIRQPGWALAARPHAQSALEALSQERDAEAAALTAAIRQRLSGRDTFEYYAARFADRHRRPLRILGITSRFTTFLQHSMRDVRQTVEALGHEFRLLIEHDDHTSMVPHPCTLAEIHDFMPDLILMIDHNRHEFGDLYDFPIPFCCWIQDDLPNLFAPDVGRKLTPHDVVVGHISRFRGDSCGYRPNQCCPVSVPVNPRVFSGEPVARADLDACRCDVSFVSNLSITAQAHLEQNLAIATQPEIRKLMQTLHDSFGPRIADGWLPATPVQTTGIIQALAADLGFQLPLQEADRLRRNFADRLVNIFFRHQTLQWAADMGLDLHIYGRGWENHPTLGRYAKGVADNGYHLRTVFQASRINLQLIPSAAVHQRLLEGLASGGFFLIRQTPADVSGRLFDAVRRRCNELGIRTEDELWNSSDARLAADIHTLNDRLYAPSRLYEGFVAELNVSVERGFQLEADVYLPHYEEVKFATRDDFQRTVTRFLSDEDVRHRIVARQRQRVVETLTYDAVLERIFGFLETYFRPRVPAAACPTAL